MPRPQIPRHDPPAPSNPLTAWFQRHKKKKSQETVQAAKKQEENERTLQTILEAIDFTHSKLPAKILAYKSNLAQRYGDLEQVARGLAQFLRKHPLTANVDVRPIDEKLIILAQRYSDAVKDGYLNAAYAAKAGLTRGILEIRAHIPTDQPELIGRFVQLNTQYLDEWITLVDYAPTADKAERNARALKAEFDKTQRQYDAEVQALYDESLSDPEKRKILTAILNGELKDAQCMNDQERAMHRAMLRQRAKKVTCELKSAMHQAAELKELSCKNAVDIFSDKLARLPIPENSSQMDRFQEALDNLSRDLAKKDVELREMLASCDEIEWHTCQVFDGEGWVKVQKVESQQAQAALEEMQKWLARQTEIAAGGSR